MGVGLRRGGEGGEVGLCGGQCAMVLVAGPRIPRICDCDFGGGPELLEKFVFSVPMCELLSGLQ